LKKWTGLTGRPGKIAATEQVQVYVKDALSCCPSGIHYHAMPRVELVFAGKQGGNAVEVAE
jgi:hypothetical protein